MRYIDSRSLLVLLGVSLLVPAPARPQDKANEEEMAKLGTTMVRLLALLEREIEKPGACPHDVPGRAAAIGYDPDKLFAFVRDGIAFEPYEGQLRGSRGALVARSANSLDRSLLLRDLLVAAGFAARLVQGRLEPGRASALLERFRKRDFARETEAFRTPRAEDRSLATEVALEAGLKPEALLQYVEEGRRKNDEQWNLAWDLGGPHRETLEKALREAGVNANVAEPALSEHYWVELRKKDEWIALDSAFADATVGQSYGVEGRPIDSVPETARGRVFVELELDRTEEDRRTPARLLRQSAPLDELLFAPLTLRLLPAQPLPSFEQMWQMKPEQVYEAVSSIRKYQAVLQVGETQHGSQPFDSEGRLYDVSGHGEVQDFGGGVTDKFGFGGDEKKKPATKLHAVVLRLTLELPGGLRRVQTRRLFEPRAADQPNFGLAQEIDIFVQPHWIGAEFATFLPAWALVQNKDAYQAAMDGRFAAPSRHVRVQLLLLQFAQFRQRAIARLLRENPSLGLAWDRPLVMVRHKRIRFLPKSREMTFVKIADIVENDAPFVPLSKEAGPGAWKANLALGTFDSCLEGVLLEDKDRVLYSDYAARHFERDRLQGARLQVVRDLEGFGAADREWIRACTPEGSVIVASSSAPRKYWWCVGARGSAVARASGGEGQDLTEYKVVAALVAFHICMFDRVYDAAKGKLNKASSGQKAYYTARILSCFVTMNLAFFGLGMAAISLAKLGLGWAAMEMSMRVWGAAVGW